MDPDESFLGEIGGVVIVLQAANQIVKEPGRVALHELVNGRIMTGDKAKHIRPVAILGIFHREGS